MIQILSMGARQRLDGYQISTSPAATKAARARHYDAGRFSFNVSRSGRQNNARYNLRVFDIAHWYRYHLSFPGLLFLPALAKHLEHKHEQIDKIEIERQGAENRLLACNLRTVGT